MKTVAFLLLAAALIITALTSGCSGTYTGPPISGSLEYQGLKGTITVHPTK